MPMLISDALAAAINRQIGNEFGASLQYYQIGAHFHRMHLQQLAKLFFAQGDEEREHAQKLLKYVVDTGASLQIPAVKQPVHEFATAEAAVAAALAWEIEVTGQIKALMDLAAGESDYLAQGFLQWFVDEQLEEVTKMERLLAVVRMSGEKHLLSVEAYLVHGHS
jgi:bacterioferritin B